jgi:hypothetical protein
VNGQPEPWLTDPQLVEEAQLHVERVWASTTGYRIHPAIFGRLLMAAPLAPVLAAIRTVAEIAAGNDPLSDGVAEAFLWKELDIRAPRRHRSR